MRLPGLCRNDSPVTDRLFADVDGTCLLRLQPNVLVASHTFAGLSVSWIPSYGPEMRSGTSICHVRLSREPIDSPLVSHPNVLMALNEPSLHKFLPNVQPGG